MVGMSTASTGSKPISSVLIKKNRENALLGLKKLPSFAPPPLDDYVENIYLLNEDLINNNSFSEKFWNEFIKRIVSFYVTKHNDKTGMAKRRATNQDISGAIPLLGPYIYYESNKDFKTYETNVKTLNKTYQLFNGDVPTILNDIDLEILNAYNGPETIQSVTGSILQPSSAAVSSGPAASSSPASSSSSGVSSINNKLDTSIKTLTGDIELSQKLSDDAEAESNIPIFDTTTSVSAGEEAVSEDTAIKNEADKLLTIPDGLISISGVDIYNNNTAASSGPQFIIPAGKLKLLKQWLSKGFKAKFYTYLPKSKPLLALDTIFKNNTLNSPDGGDKSAYTPNALKNLFNLLTTNDGIDQILKEVFTNYDGVKNIINLQKFLNESPNIKYLEQVLVTGRQQRINESLKKRQKQLEKEKEDAEIRRRETVEYAIEELKKNAKNAEFTQDRSGILLNSDKGYYVFNINTNPSTLYIIHPGRSNQGKAKFNETQSTYTTLRNLNSSSLNNVKDIPNEVRNNFYVLESNKRQLVDYLIKVHKAKTAIDKNKIIIPDFKIPNKYDNIIAYEQEIIKESNEYGSISGELFNPPGQMQLANEIHIMENQIPMLFVMTGDYIYDIAKRLILVKEEKQESIANTLATKILDEGPKGASASSATNIDSIYKRSYIGMKATELTGKLDYSHDATASAQNNSIISNKLRFKDELNYLLGDNPGDTITDVSNAFNPIEVEYVSDKLAQDKYRAGMMQAGKARMKLDGQEQQIALNQLVLETESNIDGAEKMVRLFLPESNSSSSSGPAARPPIYVYIESIARQEEYIKGLLSGTGNNVVFVFCEFAKANDAGNSPGLERYTELAKKIVPASPLNIEERFLFCDAAFISMIRPTTSDTPFIKYTSKILHPAHFLRDTPVLLRQLIFNYRLRVRNYAGSRDAETDEYVNFPVFSATVPAEDIDNPRIEITLPGGYTQIAGSPELSTLCVTAQDDRYIRITFPCMQGAKFTHMNIFAKFIRKTDGSFSIIPIFMTPDQELSINFLYQLTSEVGESGPRGSGNSKTSIEAYNIYGDQISQANIYQAISNGGDEGLELQKLLAWMKTLGDKTACDVCIDSDTINNSLSDEEQGQWNSIIPTDWKTYLYAIITSVDKQLVLRQTNSAPYKWAAAWGGTGEVYASAGIYTSDDYIGQLLKQYKETLKIAKILTDKNLLKSLIQTNKDTYSFFKEITGIFRDPASKIAILHTKSLFNENTLNEKIRIILENVGVLDGKTINSYIGSEKDDSFEKLINKEFTELSGNTGDSSSGLASSSGSASSASGSALGSDSEQVTRLIANAKKLIEYIPGGDLKDVLNWLVPVKNAETEFELIYNKYVDNAKNIFQSLFLKPVPRQPALLVERMQGIVNYFDSIRTDANIFPTTTVNEDEATKEVVSLGINNFIIALGEKEENIKSKLEELNTPFLEKKFNNDIKEKLNITYDKIDPCRYINFAIYNARTDNADLGGGYRPSKKSKSSKKNGTRHTKYKLKSLARLLSRKLKRSHLRRSHRGQRPKTQTTQRRTQRRRKSNQ